MAASLLRLGFVVHCPIGTQGELKSAPVNVCGYEYYYVGFLGLPGNGTNTVTGFQCVGVCAPATFVSRTRASKFSPLMMIPLIGPTIILLVIRDCGNLEVDMHYLVQVDTSLESPSLDCSALQA